MAKARKVRLKNLKEKGKTTYLNKEWLFSRRCIDKMSLYDIAKLCKVEYDVIYFALKKMNIPLLIDIGTNAWCDWIEKHENKIARKI